MKIKRIVGAFVLASMTAVAAAQTGATRSALDPAALTQEQIAGTQRPDALVQLLDMYQRSGDMERLTWTLERLIRVRPNVVEYKLALARTYALRDKKSQTYDLLLSMQRQGLGYDLSKDKSFDKVSATKVWKYIVDSLQTNLKPFGEGKVAFSLPKGDHLYETLGYDPARKQFLVGSVRDGTVQRMSQDGKLEDFIKPDASNGLWSVYALSVVPEDDALYVASTASVYFRDFNKDDYGKAGVFKFQLSSGKFLAKYLLEPDSDVRTLSSIVAGKGGRVFAADGLRNQIYRVDGSSLKVLVSNPQLTSVRGLALDDSGKKLYFSDYALGVFGVDLAAGKGFDLAYDAATLFLGGVDGLYWYDNALVIVQNGAAPVRVMRLSLDSDGRKITRVAPIDAGNPAFGVTAGGTVRDDDLYFIANSQRNEYGTYGTPKDGAKLAAVQVFRSDLKFNSATAMSIRSGAPMLTPPTSKPGSGDFWNVESGSTSGPAH